MENKYITNIGEDFDQMDLELIEKINELETENKKNKQYIKELKKENIEQKHRIQDLEIERDHNKETIKNQNDIINFYKKIQKEYEDNNNEQKKNEEKIKTLEESISLKDKKIIDLNKELEEQSILNKKLVADIAYKEEIIRKQEKGKILDNLKNNIKLEAKFDNVENNKELNEIRTKEGKIEVDLDTFMDDPKQKLNSLIKEHKKEIENKNDEINELKKKLNNIKKDSRNELELQNEYLNKMIEGYKNNIENMKEQKIKAIKDLNKQNEKLEIELGEYKVQLGNIQFEMDRKLVTYKRYINKLQTILESLGYKFKDKNNNINNKMKYDKAKTMV